MNFTYNVTHTLFGGNLQAVFKRNRKNEDEELFDLMFESSDFVLQKKILMQYKSIKMEKKNCLSQDNEKTTLCEWCKHYNYSTAEYCYNCKSKINSPYIDRGEQKELRDDGR